MGNWGNLLAAMHAANLSVYGEPVTYIAQGQAPVTVNVIWTEGKHIQDQIPGVRALAFAPLSIFSATPQRDDVVIRQADNRMFRVTFDAAKDWTDMSGGISLPLRYIQG